MTHRSKWHQRKHLIRKHRRAALAGNKAAYHRYIWLCNHPTHVQKTAPIARQLLRIGVYKNMHKAGYTMNALWRR